LLWEAFLSSDPIGRGIVIILAICSVISWSLMAYKVSELRGVKRKTRRFITRFKRVKLDPFTITLPAGGEPDPASQAYLAGCRELAGQLETAPVPDRLTARGLERIEYSLTRSIEEDADVLKDWMIVLATFAATGPMLGIFGTVYGVLIAFMGMGESRAATIDAVAPGIAGALFTTVAGLIVAIPALIGYNFINNQIERLTNGLYRFASDFALSAEEHYPLIDSDTDGLPEEEI